MQNTNRAQESGYKASLTREQFLFHEMRIVAKQMVQGEDLASMIQIIAANNLFQYPTERRPLLFFHVNTLLTFVLLLFHSLVSSNLYIIK